MNCIGTFVLLKQIVSKW